MEAPSNYDSLSASIRRAMEQARRREEPDSSPLTPVGSWDTTPVNHQLRIRSARNLEPALLPITLKESVQVAPESRASTRRNTVIPRPPPIAETMPVRATPHATPTTKRQKYHAVRRGHETAICHSAADAAKLITGHRKPIWQPFYKAEEAEDYVNHPADRCPGYSSCRESCKQESLLQSLAAQEEAQTHFSCPCCATSVLNSQALCDICMKATNVWRSKVAHDYSLDELQSDVLRLAAEGHNLFITGSAASGKSRILQACMKYFEGLGTVVQAVAPANLPASNIGGTTLRSHMHSYVGCVGKIEELSMEGIAERASAGTQGAALPATDVLVMDEVSMIDSNDFTRTSAAMSVAANAVYSDKAQEPFGGAQVILSADFLQLPPRQPLANCIWCGGPTKPALTRRTLLCKQHGHYEQCHRFAFSSPVWDACRFIYCHLEGEYREQDQIVLRALRGLRAQSVMSHEQYAYLFREARSIDHPDAQVATILYSDERMARDHNKAEVSRIQQDAKRYIATDTFLWHQQRHPGLADYETKAVAEGKKSSLRALFSHEFAYSQDLKVGMLVLLVADLSAVGGARSGSLGRIVEWHPMEQVPMPQLADSSPSDAAYPGQVLQGRHAHYQQAQIEQFWGKQREDSRWCPVVQFWNGTCHLVAATCAIQELGHGSPKSLLSRTQIPLVPGYAMSIYQSQGLTLDSIFIDLEKHVVAGHAYTALSRARNMKTVTLVSLPQRTQRVYEVQSFYCDAFDDGARSDTEDEDGDRDTSREFEDEEMVDRDQEEEAVEASESESGKGSTTGADQSGEMDSGDMSVEETFRLPGPQQFTFRTR